MSTWPRSNDDPEIVLRLLRTFACGIMKNGESVMTLAPVLTPHGVLTLRPSGDGASLEPALAARLEEAFAKGPGHGLLCLGADEVSTVLPPVLSYWREFGSRY